MAKFTKLTTEQRRASMFRAMFNIHRTKCKARNFFNFERWKALVIQPCFYCGDIDTKTLFSAPSYRRQYPNLTDAEVAASAIRVNGIDRLNPRLPYTAANSVACCKRCNWQKGNMSFAEFVRYCGHVYETHKAKL